MNRLWLRVLLTRVCSCLAQALILLGVMYASVPFVLALGVGLVTMVANVRILPRYVARLKGERANSHSP